MGYSTLARWPGVTLVVAVVAALALSAGSILSTQGQEETTFYACALPNGNLSKISVEEPDCPRNMTLVSWDQTGPMGPPGEKGDQGDPGAQGAPGVDGVDGQDGAPGVDGADGQDGADGADGLGVGAGSCTTGNVVMGIDAQGELICASLPVTGPALHVKFIDHVFCAWRIIGTGFAPGVEVRVIVGGSDIELDVNLAGTFTTAAYGLPGSVELQSFFATDTAGNSAHTIVNCAMYPY